MEPTILHNDAIHCKNGYKGYVTSEKTQHGIRKIQIMWTEYATGKPVSWYKRIWYVQSDVIVLPTQTIFQKSLSESSK